MMTLSCLSILAFLGALAPTRALTVSNDLRVQATRHAWCTGGCDKLFGELKEEILWDFPSLVKRDQWEAQVRKIAKNASGDPCNADIVATSYGRYSGLASRMNSFLVELLLGMYRGHSFALCASNNDMFIERIWSPHFQNVAGFPVCNTTTKSCQTWRSATPHTLRAGNWLGTELKRMDREYVDDLKHSLYPYIFTLTPATHALVDQRLRDAGLTAGEPYVAVHVRHGDKFLEAARLETGHYADAARPYLARDRKAASNSSAWLRETLLREVYAAKVSLVYVSSDDPLAANEIQQELGGTVRVVRQPPQTDESFARRNYRHEEDLLQLLTDVEALRRAKCFIGTASSNVGRLAYFLRPKGSVSISLDTDWLDVQF